MTRVAGGYNTLADVVQTTADGVDFSLMWTELSQTVDLRNGHRDAIERLLSTPVTTHALEIAQAAQNNDFEDSSEFGVPQGVRPLLGTLRVGFPFRWRDLATRFTWRALAEMSRDQIAAVGNAALEADNRQTFRAAMSALMVKTTAATRPVNAEGDVVYGLWDGEADSVPPDYANNIFAAGHQHYLTTGSTFIDGQDLKLLVRHVTHHGFGGGNGSQIVVFCHPNEGETIRGLRVDTGSPFDFIPSETAPAFLTKEQIVGQQPPSSYGSMGEIGGFGNSWVIEDDFVPAGYVLAVATGGPDSAANVLAMRQSVNPGLQGLRLFPGSNSSYPLVDSYYARGFGFGVAHRGGAAVMQVTTSNDYTNPTFA